MIITKKENRKQAKQAKRSQRKAKRERKQQESRKKVKSSKAARKRVTKMWMWKLNKKSTKNLIILAKITIKWCVAVCEA